MNAAKMSVVIVRENALVETVMVFADRTKAEDWCRAWANDPDIHPGPDLTEEGVTDAEYRAEPWRCDWWDDATGIDFFVDIWEEELSDPEPVVHYRCGSDGADWFSDDEARCPGCGNSAESVGEVVDG
jgi:hypothetical protein